MRNKRTFLLICYLKRKAPELLVSSNLLRQQWWCSFASLNRQRLSKCIKQRKKNARSHFCFPSWISSQTPTGECSRIIFQRIPRWRSRVPEHTRLWSKRLCAVLLCSSINIISKTRKHYPKSHYGCCHADGIPPCLQNRAGKLSAIRGLRGHSTALSPQLNSL